MSIVAVYTMYRWSISHRFCQPQGLMRGVDLADRWHRAHGDGRNMKLYGGPGLSVWAGAGYGGWEDVAPSHMKILVGSSYSGSLATLITNIRIFGDV